MLLEMSAVSGVRETITNLQAADAELLVKMMDDARQNIPPIWDGLISARSRGLQDSATIVSGSAVVVGATGFGVFAAQSSVPLSGGLVPSEQWQGVEFGARTRRKSFTTHSRKGKAYTVTKTINRGLPSRQKNGQVAFKAISEAGTALIRGWIESMAATYNDAVGGDPQ